MSRPNRLNVFGGVSRVTFPVNCINTWGPLGDMTGCLTYPDTRWRRILLKGWKQISNPPNHLHSIDGLMGAVMELMSTGWFSHSFVIYTAPSYHLTAISHLHTLLGQFAKALSAYLSCVDNISRLWNDAANCTLKPPQMCFRWEKAGGKELTIGFSIILSLRANSLWSGIWPSLPGPGWHQHGCLQLAASS